MPNESADSPNGCVAIARIRLRERVTMEHPSPIPQVRGLPQHLITGGLFMRAHNRSPPRSIHYSEIPVFYLPLSILSAALHVACAEKELIAISSVKGVMESRSQMNSLAWNSSTLYLLQWI
ncbi:hypothetical protein CDAR_205761 [Caerostris darwini]|uniref:Uncharacterized protein n=1 Tax=Caerostris darwini TaxID=1538125 RepID=A0AAV4WXV1_9ARAC|nr:hypothetical protein CDAR_205761 [Caerostris darwini]